MRLIDADELLEQLATLLKKSEEEAYYSGRREATVGWDDAIFAIKAAQTVDSVNHGQWEMYDTYKQTIDGRTFDGWCECSECRTMFPWGFSDYNYCPNCGCKMMV